MAKERTLKPKPIASVRYIDFGTVDAGMIQKAVITVKNCGGEYKNLKVIPELWFKIATMWHKNSINEITMRLETDCRDPGIIYRGFLTILMDKEKTRVRVRVKTKPGRKAVVIPKTGKTKARPKPEEKPEEPQPASTASPPDKEIPPQKTPPDKKPAPPKQEEPPSPPLPPDKKPRKPQPPNSKKKTGKLKAVLIIIGSLAAVIAMVTYPAPTSHQKIEPPLDNLDAFIESVVVPSMTKIPKEWHNHWYNDYATTQNDIWVVGGVTVTKENRAFETVNFVFYSPDWGESWQVKWDTGQVESARFFGAKLLKVGGEHKVFVLLEGAFAARWMLYTTDYGESWRIQSKWNPKKV
jgi:hypothetical protein